MTIRAEKVKLIRFPPRFGDLKIRQVRPLGIGSKTRIRGIRRGAFFSLLRRNLSLVGQVPQIPVETYR